MSPRDVSDLDVLGDVEAALLRADKPYRLWDLNLRCRGRVDQIEQAANKLVAEGRAVRVRYAWAHRFGSVDIAKWIADGLESGPQNPKAGTSKYDPLIERIAGIVADHPGGIGKEALLVALGQRGYPIPHCIQTAIKRGLVFPERFGRQVAYFPPGVPRNPSQLSLVEPRQPEPVAPPPPPPRRERPLLRLVSDEPPRPTLRQRIRDAVSEAIEDGMDPSTISVDELARRLAAALRGDPDPA